MILSWQEYNYPEDGEGDPRRDVRFAQAHRLSDLARQVKREPKHNSRHAERCSRLYAGDA